MRRPSSQAKRDAEESRGADHQEPVLDQDNVGSPSVGEPTYLVVGKLRRPHGVKGEMLMDILTDFPQRLRRGKQVYVGSTHQPLILLSIRSKNEALLVKFEGYEDCDQVGVFRNMDVFVKASSLPSLPVGEYYFHQLIGLRVVDEAGNALGELREILETGANDVYLVETPNKEEILLPAIDEVIREVALERGEIVVRPPEWM